MAAARARGAVRRALRRRALRRRRQGPAQHDRLRCPHRRAPPGRGRRSGSRPGSPTGSRATSRRPSTASRWRSTPPRPASRSTTTASVAEAGGEESWDPVRLWNYFTGGEAFEAEVERRRAHLQRVPRPDSTSSTAPRPATARSPSTGDQIETTEARTGAALDPSDTLDRAAGGVPRRGPRGRRARRWPRCSPTSTRPTSRRRSTASPSPAVAAPGDAELRGLQRQGLPGRLHRGAQPGADRRRARADPRPGEAHRGRRRQGHAAARRSTPPSRWSAADRRSCRPSRA